MAPKSRMHIEFRSSYLQRVWQHSQESSEFIAVYQSIPCDLYLLCLSILNSHLHVLSIIVATRRICSCVRGGKKMEGISILTDDALLHIFKRLDIEDLISFAYTCERFRQICMEGRVFRKVDLSRCPFSRTQRDTMKNFFTDKQMVQYIRELNLSNLRVYNWNMDDQLIQEFINSLCPHLEALHVLDCGMSLQSLHHILKQAPKLTSLSWSLWDLTSEDIEFVIDSIRSGGICLKNIKHLYLDIFQSKPQIHLLNYLVLSHCRDLEELEISSWPIYVPHYTGWGLLLPTDRMIASLSQASPSIDSLQHLHSLTVQAVGGFYPCSHAHYYLPYVVELCNFIFSIFRRKSHKTNWKKLWISPPISISSLQDLCHFLDSSISLHEVHVPEFNYTEAVTAHVSEPFDAVDELKTFFQRIDDNTVRSLHLCQPMSEANSILELCEPISRVGGHTLKSLSLSFNPPLGTDAVKTVVFHTLFSNCRNITDLDLLGCYFEKDICEPLSKLKHLTRVQLVECAISSRCSKENQVVISKSNLLTFVENCKNVTDFVVSDCLYNHKQFSCCLKEGDLLALAKLRKLKSLTIYQVAGIREWTFMQRILENCNFLTMLRISAIEHFNNPIFLESAKLLKHLAFDLPQLDLGSEGFWKLLSHAKNLERLCITSNFKGSLNVSGALEMLKSMSGLYVFHVHLLELENHKIFCDQVIKTLEEEDSDRTSCFEFLVHGSKFEQEKICSHRKSLIPLNFLELCRMVPIMAIPTL